MGYLLVWCVIVQTCGVTFCKAPQASLPSPRRRLQRHVEARDGRRARSPALAYRSQRNAVHSDTMPHNTAISAATATYATAPATTDTNIEAATAIPTAAVLAATAAAVAAATAAALPVLPSLASRAARRQQPRQLWQPARADQTRVRTSLRLQWCRL